MEQGLQKLNAGQRTAVWAERIAACRSSDLTVRAWCREKQLSEKTYYYWQHRLFKLAAEQQASFAECIFRLHPATCTVFFCHLAEQNPPPCRGCLPLHRWCKGSARSLRSGKALASKVQLVNQSS